MLYCKCFMHFFRLILNSKHHILFGGELFAGYQSPLFTRYVSGCIPWKNSIYDESNSRHVWGLICLGCLANQKTVSICITCRIGFYSISTSDLCLPCMPGRLERPVTAWDGSICSFTYWLLVLHFISMSHFSGISKQREYLSS